MYTDYFLSIGPTYLLRIFGCYFCVFSVKHFCPFYVLARIVYPSCLPVIRVVASSSPFTVDYGVTLP